MQPNQRLHQRLPIEETVRAVFRVIRDHDSEGEVEKVLAVLPHDLQKLLVGHSTV